MDQKEIAVEIVLEEGASLPSYATLGSAGMDVRSIEPVTLQPGERKLVRTGIRVSIPIGFEIQVRPRSGLAMRHGLSLVNTPGTIDSDFRGEIQILMINLGASVVELEAGERIAQLVLCPVVRCEWNLVESLEATARAEGGFGSTGRQ